MAFITTDTSGGIPTLKINGEGNCSELLQETRAQELRDAIVAVGTGSNVTIDCHRVNYMGSESVGAVVSSAAQQLSYWEQDISLP